MYLSIYIVIGIIAVLAFVFMIVKKTGTNTKIINKDDGKNEQFNPEKVSGLMPNEQKSDIDKEKEKK